MPSVIYTTNDYTKRNFKIQDIELDIPLNKGNKIELPYYGIEFASKTVSKDEQGEESVTYESYWKEDKDKDWENTLAYRLISAYESKKDVEIKMKEVVSLLEEDKKGKEDYHTYVYLLRYNSEDSLFFKPTVQYPVSDAMNVESVATLEFLFSFEDDFILPVYKTYNTGGTGSMMFLDMVRDSFYDLTDLRDFEDFFGDCGNVKFNREDNIVEIDMCDTYGNLATLEFSNDKLGLQEISRALCSVRLVELEEKISMVKEKVLIRH